MPVLPDFAADLQQAAGIGGQDDLANGATLIGAHEVAEQTILPEARQRFAQFRLE